MRQRAIVAVAVVLWILSGCGGQETVQAPPQSSEEKKAAEQKKAGADQSALTGLGVGEPAEFPSGIITTVEGVRVILRPDVPEYTIGPTGREEKNRSKEGMLANQLAPSEVLVAGEVASTNTGSAAVQTKNDGSPLGQFEATQFGARDENGYILTRAAGTHLPETMTSPEYPLQGWQGPLEPGQERRGTVLFKAPLDAEFRLLYNPMGNIDGPGIKGEWDLGSVSEMPAG